MEIKLEKVVISKNTKNDQFFQYVTVELHTTEEWPKLIKLELRCDNNVIDDEIDNLDNIIHLFTLRNITMLESTTKLDIENNRTMEVVKIAGDGETDDYHYEFIGKIIEIDQHWSQMNPNYM